MTKDRGCKQYWKLIGLETTVTPWILQLLATYTSDIKDFMLTCSKTEGR